MKRPAAMRAGLLGALLLACSLRAGSADLVALYVPSFQSDNATLGLSVATVLNLQVWQTLRKAPWPNPHRIFFGDGLVVWDQWPLLEANHESAEQAARRIYNASPQLVMWGKCYRYGEGVVVQAYLTLTEQGDTRERQPERWAVRLPATSGEEAIRADVPARRYAFEPIVLTRQVVDMFSRPDGLKLYSAQQGGEVLGLVGSEFVALEHAGPTRVKVRSGGVTGWVRLERLAKERSEVTDFTGGVVRAYRGDWGGARALMGKVVDNGRAPTQLKIDAHLYRAMAAVQSGLDPEADLAAAEALNPYARRVVVYRAMALLAGYADKNAVGRRAILAAVDKLVAERGYVFLPEDPWLARWKEVRSRLGDG